MADPVDRIQRQPGIAVDLLATVSASRRKRRPVRRGMVRTWLGWTPWRPPQGATGRYYTGLWWVSSGSPPSSSWKSVSGGVCCCPAVLIADIWSAMRLRLSIPGGKEAESDPRQFRQLTSAEKKENETCRLRTEAFRPDKDQKDGRRHNHVQGRLCERDLVLGRKHPSAGAAHAKEALGDSSVEGSAGGEAGGRRVDRRRGRGSCPQRGSTGTRTGYV